MSKEVKIGIFVAVAVVIMVVGIIIARTMFAYKHVDDMFNDAKRNTFRTEVQVVLMNSELNYMMDGYEKFYNSINGKSISECSNSEDLHKLKDFKNQDVDNLSYYINISSDKITELYVVGDLFAYSITGEDIDYEHINTKDIINFNEQEYNDVINKINSMCY
ncbi:MAG: hypothetical protein IJB83_05360 [Bacilli bacterium]|nr:hypothetical protein [Bacilli bacterium]